MAITGHSIDFAVKARLSAMEIGDSRAYILEGGDRLGEMQMMGAFSRLAGIGLCRIGADETIIL